MNLEFCLYLFWCILLYQRGRADHFERFLSFLFTSMHRYLLNLLSGFDTMHGFKWLELFTSCCLSRVPWCCIWLLGILFSLFCFQFKVNFIFRFGLIHIPLTCFWGYLCLLWPTSFRSLGCLYIFDNDQGPSSLWFAFNV